MEVFDAIMTRRSVRKFKDIQIENHLIIKLLEAAMNAPSAGNQRAWQYVVVTDKKLLLKISEIHPYANALKTAPLAIIVCGDLKIEKHKDFWVQDCSAAIQNILLTAHAESLGAVWLGVYPRLEREKEIKELINLPDNVIILGIIAIGYPDEILKPEKRFEIEKVHHNKFGNKFII